MRSSMMLPEKDAANEDAGGEASDCSHSQATK